MQVDNKFQCRFFVAEEKEYELVDIDGRGRKTFLLSSNDEKISITRVKEFILECNQCHKRKVVNSMFRAFKRVNTAWICQSCKRLGEKNGFYGKKWKECFSEDQLKAYCEKRSANMLGSKNHMYGKSIQEIWKSKMSETELKEKKEKYSLNMKNATSGEKNGFYGKIHTQAAIDKITLKNKAYRQKADILLLQRYSDAGMTKERVENLFTLYENKFIEGFNSVDLAIEAKMDIRTLKSLAIRYGIKTRDELKALMDKGKYERTISRPERILIEKCENVFGIDNVKRQFNISGFIYDACIGNKLLVEYDGYYWHTEHKSASRDLRKDTIAKLNGYDLVRIKEDKNRKYDLDKAIKEIKERYEKV